MNINLTCKLFGHKFIGYLEDGFMVKGKLNYCIRCGLNKDELLFLKGGVKHE